ncbi:hypothetical protein ACI0X9_003359 [Cronobacter turicensis]
MNLPTVVFVCMTNGEEILGVNGKVILASEESGIIHGLYQTAVTLSATLGVNLVEYNNTPLLGFDTWTAQDVLDSLPDLPFTCGHCGRVYQDTVVCTSDDCPGNTLPVSQINDQRRDKVLKYLMDAYSLDLAEAIRFAEEGGYSYVRCGDLAAHYFYSKKVVPLHS